MANKIIKNGFEYVWPIPDDKYDDVIIHLRNNFFHDEPLNNAMNLCKKGEEHEELEEHSLKTLRDNYSIMACECVTKQIVGVMLNKAVQKEDYVNDLEKLCSIPDASYRKIFNFLYNANVSLSVFEEYDISSLLEHRIVSVDNEYRNKGIAKELGNISEDVAKSNGFKLLKADATNMYSRKLFERRGFNKILEISYQDYKTDEGEVVFKIPEPHTSFSIMTKFLDN